MNLEQDKIANLFAPLRETNNQVTQMQFETIQRVDSMSTT
jgi:hypothetical protein